MQGKVALYTIFRCTNYGAVLQAYALARILRSICGEDAVDVLNHRMDPRDNHLLGKISNPNTPWFQRWRNRRKFAARYFRPDLFEERRRNTIRLIGEGIRPTERLYRSPQEMADLPRYSTVVVGSDQVWNPALNHDFGCNQYLASHLPEGQDRVAYAASFGVSALPPEFEGEYRAALSRFREITVREESGAEILKKLLPHRDAPHVVLDPTMLLPPDEWRSLVIHPSPHSSHLSSDPQLSTPIVAYWVRTVTQSDVDALAAVARRCGAAVALMSAGPLPKLSFPDEVTPRVDAGPFDLVHAVASASCVVTDSFHGLQFATAFSRPFVALGDLNAPGSNASRLIDFCARYGLNSQPSPTHQLPTANCQIIHDISAFRSGGEMRFADPSEFSRERLDVDRATSIAALKRMVEASFAL